MKKQITILLASLLASMSINSLAASPVSNAVLGLHNEIKSFYYGNPFPNNIQQDFIKRDKNIPSQIIIDDGVLRLGNIEISLFNKEIVKGNFGYELRLSNLDPATCYDVVASLAYAFDSVSVNNNLLKNTGSTNRRDLSNGALLQSCSNESNTVGLGSL